MQIDKTPHPTIRHTDVNLNRKKFRAVLAAFEKEILSQVEKGIGSMSFEPSEANLLLQRRALAAAVKRGMLERKDDEASIAMLAALVWYLRLDRERREKIEFAW